MDTFYIALGDENPVLEADLVDASGTSLIEDGDEVKLYVIMSDGEVEEHTATVTDVSEGTVQVQFSDDTFDESWT